jgi:putative ABC transport system ATP-binding protein
METLIKVENLNKTFNLGKTSVSVLKDVTFDIYKGEYLSVMGPSGSGKSTLFNMIGVLDRPTSGIITVAGIDLTKLSGQEMAFFRSNYIGYVFQAYNLLPQYSAIDNVAMPLIFSGKEYSVAIEKAKQVLKKVGLEHRMTHRPDELSGGQQQRVAIARALANNPIIILADEPTGNLDLHTGEEIIQLMGTLSKEQGVTIISATHDHKMLSMSDRILWISDGKIDKIQLRSELDIKVGVVK